MKDVYSDRQRKAEKINNMYSSRRYTQKRIADELGMTEDDVRKVTKAYNFVHTKELEKGNLNPGQKIKPIVDFEKMNYLDKYTL